MTPFKNELPLTLQFPNNLSVSFDGFGDEAFQTLQAIKEAPRIETYRSLKPVIDRAITKPFKQFRDDLVVNWVLPNALPFETERNVFSRLLKNDFGAGGCHHHLWMAFYRMGLRRLSDLQLAHTIRESGFSTSLYIGENAPALFKQMKAHIMANPAFFMQQVNPILEIEQWSFRIRPHKEKGFIEYENPLSKLPDELERSKGIWWRTFYNKDTILNRGQSLLASALHSVNDLWPLYIFLLNDGFPHSAPKP